MRIIAAFQCYYFPDFYEFTNQPAFGPGSSQYIVLSMRYACIHYNDGHNGRDGVSNHQPHHYLLNRLFGRRSKKTSKLCVTGLCVGNLPGTGEFRAQMASNAENVSIWWRHYVNQARDRENCLVFLSEWPRRMPPDQGCVSHLWIIMEFNFIIPIDFSVYLHFNPVACSYDYENCALIKLSRICQVLLERLYI